MKKYIVSLIIILLGASTACSQTRVGNTYKSEPRKTVVKDTLVTKYNYEDNIGNTYNIIINKSSGSCYIWKKSTKSGKMYKSYMKPEISQEISREYGIAYKPRK